MMAIETQQNVTLPAMMGDVKNEMDILFLSKATTWIIIFVNFSVLCTLIALLGIVANVINMAVFIQQGFTDTVNVSLFTLAIADMVSLIFLIWIGVCYDPFLQKYTLPFELTQVVYLTGGQPRLYFTRVAGWITSLVAMERCCCVLKPMQVKLVFTKNRVTVAIVFIFVAAFATMVPVYYTTRLSWKFDFVKNRSYVGMSFIDNNHQIDRLSFALGVTVTTSAFVVVTSCTFILGYSLLKQSRWRAKSMSVVVKDVTDDTDKNRDQNSKATDEDRKQGKAKTKNGGINEMSTRDRQAVRTVTFIAAMFVVCFSPNVVSLSLMSIFPEYNKNAKYENLFLSVWSFAQMAEAFCSSANILVYYRTSTKYKQTFLTLFKENPLSKIRNWFKK